VIGHEVAARAPSPAKHAFAELFCSDLLPDTPFDVHSCGAFEDKGHVMPPMKLLAELAQALLPRAFEDRDDIEKIRVLKAHGHVEASIPPWRVDSAQQPATVYAVTAHGRRALGNA
jgi:hypothetical protein